MRLAAARTQSPPAVQVAKRRRNHDLAGRAHKRSLLVKRYDVMGRVAFRAYPVATLANGYVDSALTGTTSTYGALGRPLTTTQTSEMGADDDLDLPDRVQDPSHEPTRLQDGHRLYGLRPAEC